jgi:DNA-binding GntR family transcriptional regulator
MNTAHPVAWQADVDVGYAGASEQVYLGIIRDLEDHRMVPGQRLVVTDLALRFGVGRNAVREAIQRLAARGVIDTSRNKSPSIRSLDLAETLDVLDAAAAMTALAASAAARAFRAELHADMLEATECNLTGMEATPVPGAFSRARRRFYRTILTIGGSRELQRLFRAIGMHILYSQFRSRRLQDARIVDYCAISEAISAQDIRAAKRASHNHVRDVRRSGQTANMASAVCAFVILHQRSTLWADVVDEPRTSR